MFIPDLFEMGIHTVKVKKDMVISEGDYGEWFTARKEIHIAPKDPAWSDTFYTQIYFHEMIHAVLEHVGRVDLSENEGFVDAFSEVLLQILMSARVDPKKRKNK